MARAFEQPSANETAQVLHGTEALTFDGDLAAQMVEALDGYVSRAIVGSIEGRVALWNRDYSSHNAYTESVEPNRARLRKRIGCLDSRLPIEELSYSGTTKTSAQLTEDERYTVSRVRWQVFDEVEGEGLLLEPKHNVPMTAQIVALPDADWTPEMIAGVADELPANAQFARRLAKAGCRVVVPLLINRDDTYSGNPTLGAMTNQPHREFIYRMAFELGRHIIGYEVQKVLSLVDWMSLADAPMGVIGYGEGGLIALYSAAVDTRIQAAAVSGYFQSRQEVWREPIYRNVWGLLHEFGDAEIASLIAPRPLVIETSRGPEVDGPPPVREGRGGAAPGQLVSPPIHAVEPEFERARDFYQKHLGLTVRREGGDENCFMNCGEHFLALFRNKTPGLNHYCYTIKNYDPARAVDKLKAVGLKPRRTSDRVYFDDPDGITVQVSAPNK